MAVIYDLYRTPMPEEKKNKVRYHARPVTHGTVDTEEIASQISERCSLNPVDVIATLSALKDLLGRHLRNGERVHLDGIGYFHISLSCEELRGLKDKRVPKVKLKSVTFRADKKLHSEVRYRMEFERSKFKNRSSILSNIEIDALLTRYFAEGLSITRPQFEELCGLKESTAYRHIKRLVAEKKLQNIGHERHPIYVPVPGNYRVSVDRSR